MRSLAVTDCSKLLTWITRSGSLANQLSRKLLSALDRLECLSFRNALASICRTRSGVTENCWPTSPSVWSLFMPRPNRTMRSSRADLWIFAMAPRGHLPLTRPNLVCMRRLTNPSAYSQPNPQKASNKLASIALLTQYVQRNTSPRCRIAPRSLRPQQLRRSSAHTGKFSFLEPYGQEFRRRAIETRTALLSPGIVLSKATIGLAPRQTAQIPHAIPLLFRSWPPNSFFALKAPEVLPLMSPPILRRHKEPKIPASRAKGREQSKQHRDQVFS